MLRHSATDMLQTNPFTVQTVAINFSAKLSDDTGRGYPSAKNMDNFIQVIRSMGHSLSLAVRNNKTDFPMKQWLCQYSAVERDEEGIPLVRNARFEIPHDKFINFPSSCQKNA